MIKLIKWIMPALLGMGLTWGADEAKEARQETTYSLTSMIAETLTPYHEDLSCTNRRSTHGLRKDKEGKIVDLGWKDIFYFTDGSYVKRSFTTIIFRNGPNSLHAEALSIPTGHVGGLGDLNISIDQSREEFIQSLLHTGLYNNEENDRRKLLANWTRVYSTVIDDFIIVHTPEYVQIGGDRVQYENVSKMINDFVLTHPLDINVFQSEEVFTKALLESGLYDPEVERIKESRNSWTHVFHTKVYATITRAPLYIKLEDMANIEARYTACFRDVLRVGHIVCANPLNLNLFQSKEEFESALLEAGLL